MNWCFDVLFRKITVFYSVLLWSKLHAKADISNKNEHIFDHVRKSLNEESSISSLSTKAELWVECFRTAKRHRCQDKWTRSLQIAAWDRTWKGKAKYSVMNTLKRIEIPLIISQFLGHDVAYAVQKIWNWTVRWWLLSFCVYTDKSASEISQLGKNKVHTTTAYFLLFML